MNLPRAKYYPWLLPNTRVYEATKKRICVVGAGLPDLGAKTTSWEERHRSVEVRADVHAGYVPIAVAILRLFGAPAPCRRSTGERPREWRRGMWDVMTGGVKRQGCHVELETVKRVAVSGEIAEGGEAETETETRRLCKSIGRKRTLASSVNGSLLDVGEDGTLIPALGNPILTLTPVGLANTLSPWYENREPQRKRSRQRTSYGRSSQSTSYASPRENQKQHQTEGSAAAIDSNGTSGSLGSGRTGDCSDGDTKNTSISPLDWPRIPEAQRSYEARKAPAQSYASRLPHVKAQTAGMPEPCIHGVGALSYALPARASDQPFQPTYTKTWDTGTG
ncbi:hypothetical protein DFH09DRAFT_1406421 [Mycena vulgaris]|nr:hypothetical protein DFH09DRAFT_1406421 [Mycena vulgaris]